LKDNMAENFAPANLTPPAGFKFNEDILSDYEEQVQDALAEAAYQAAPLPSFEGVPTLDITPTLNPTGAPDSEIFARNRMPQSLRPARALRSEWTNDDQQVEMWRVVERAKLEDGTGLVSSRILHDNRLGDVEGFDSDKHLLSNHERRMGSQDTSTPFISFSTDPVNLAERAILRNGFGARGQRDSVVVRVKVDPDRVITGPKKKDPEVLLLGGVAPTEYVAAYSLFDFIAQLVPEGEVTTVHGDTMGRDQVLGHWALHK
jgi:hypothetical protein